MDDVEKESLEDESSKALLRRQLEDLEVRSLSLVETVLVPPNGGSLFERECKLLFLSERQALSLDLRGRMESFMDMMGFTPRPKLLIVLPESLAFMCSMSVNSSNETYWRNMYAAAGRISTNDGYIGAEPGGVAGLEETEKRLARFMETCVLKLAVETNALIIVKDNICSLTNVLSRLSKLEAAKNGGKLPYHILSIGQAELYHEASSRPGTLAHALRHGSKRWRNAAKAVEKVYSRRPSKVIGIEPPSYATHFVVCEGVRYSDDGTFKSSYRGFFQISHILVQQLSSVLPNVAFQTMAFRWYLIDGASALGSFVSSNLPVVLLDSRTRELRGIENMEKEKFTTPEVALDWFKKGVNNVRSRLKEEDMVDFQQASVLAFAHSVYSKFCSDQQTKLVQHDWRGSSIAMAIQDAQKGIENSSTINRTGNWSDSEWLLNELVELMINLDQENEKWAYELTQRCDTESLVKLGGAINAATSNEEISEIVLNTGSDLIPERISDAYERLFGSLVSDKESFKGEMHPQLRLQIPEHMSVQDVKSILLGLISDWKAGPRPRMRLYRGVHPDTKVEVRANLRVVLRSPSTVSCLLDDMDTITAKASEIAIKDRLPNSNTLEAMKVLQGAWDKVDIFTMEAHRHKRVSKICFVVMLLVNACVTLNTTIALNEPSLVPSETLDVVVLLLGAFGTVIASIVAFSNPMARWQLLRAAALEIEAEIWQFRTRTGRYQFQELTHITTAEQKATMTLRDTIKTISEKLDSSSALEFGTIAVHVAKVFDGILKPELNEPAKWSKHGQHLQQTVSSSSNSFPTLPAKPKNEKTNVVSVHPVGGTDEVGPVNHDLDDHHSPLSTLEYLRLRVLPMVGFYRQRIAPNSRIRTMIEIVAVAGSLSTTVLAFFNYGTWAAVPAAVTAAVASMGQFQGSDAKLRRYSSAISEIDDVLTWWRSLTTVEQRSAVAGAGLVETCEEVFRKERNAWLAVSVAARRSLDKVVNNTNNSNNKHEPEKNNAETK